MFLLTCRPLTLKVWFLNQQPWLHRELTGNVGFWCLNQMYWVKICWSSAGDLCAHCILRSIAVVHYSYNSILGILIVFTIVFLFILNNIIIYFLVPVSFVLWCLSFQSPLYSLFVLFSLSLSQIVFFLGTLPYHMGFQILNTLYYDYQMFWLISSLIMKWSRTCGPSPSCSQPDFWL